jgi:hypothetical protein
MGGSASGIGAGSIWKSGSSLWTPQKPLGGETPTQWFTSRSGLNMVDSLGGASAPIQLPYLYKPTGNEYAYVADNGALDIINNLGVNPATPGGDTGFTLCGWCKSETTDKTVIRYLMGKLTTSVIIGLYGIGANITTGVLFAQLRSSGGVITLSGTTDFTAGGSPWYFLRMDVNYTTKKLRLFVNEVQEGVDTSFTGTLSQMTDAFEFCIGTGNDAGTGFQKIALSSHSDTYIFPFLLTTAQGAALMARGSVPGATFYTDCRLQADNVIYEYIAGRHLTGVNLLKATKKKYDSNGTRQSLEIGYTRYTKVGSQDIQIPYKSAGVPSTVVPDGFTVAENNPVSATGHNLADSYIPVTGVDRSDTSMCSYLARRTDLKYFYNSVNVSWIHATEMYNLLLSNIFHAAYRGLRFSKITNRVLTDFYVYATNKTNLDYDKPIIYSGETTLLKFDVLTDTHIVAINGLKVLKFNDVHTLSLSLDGGVTYPITLVTTLDLVDYGFIFDNGNIMFCDSTKTYYSDDNLATYQESTVTGADGNPFVAGTLQNFRPWCTDFREVTHNGVKLHVWGTYATSGTAVDVNINLWETTDGGVNIKSVYLFGVTDPVLICRHVHYFNYDPDTDAFYIGTGDDDADKQNMMSGTRDGGTGAWTFTSIGKGTAASVWEHVGMVFDNNYFYIAGERTTPANIGIRRSLKSDIANIATNQVRIFASDFGQHLVDLDGYYIFCHGATAGDDTITWSRDMQNFITRKFPQLVVNPAVGGYGTYTCRGKMANGYYMFWCNENGETVHNFPKGSVLLVKPTVIS